jgi:hypothetical protein
MEQITYLLFLRRLDELHTLEENKSNRLKKPMEKRIFPTGRIGRGTEKKDDRRPYDDLRWSRFKNFDPDDMFLVVSEYAFPFLRELGGDGSTYVHHMKDARFTIPTPRLLATAVDLLEQVPMEDRDTKGDVYEHLLSEIATAGQNGQFRTPRHIIQLMTELTAPGPKDVICDPACGTAGFLVSAGEYLREHHPEVLRDAKLKKHFHHEAFHGFDFDSTMLRIGRGRPRAPSCAPSARRAASDRRHPRPGGGDSSQAPRRPRPARHAPPSHLPRDVRRPRTESTEPARVALGQRPRYIAQLWDHDPGGRGREDLAVASRGQHPGLEASSR